MSSDLLSFVTSARDRGLDNVAIKEKLLSQGWDESSINDALDGREPLEVPKPPSTQPSPQPFQTYGPGATSVSVANQTPVPVVQNLSTRGIEYKIMFFALWISAISFGGLLHDAVDGLTGGSSYPHIGGLFGITALVVCGPIFAYLFIRLKTAEFSDETLRLDQSRKGVIQATLIFSFLIGVANLIGMIYLILSSGNEGIGSEVNVVTLSIHTLITIAICGGIFGYWWRDIHRD